MRIKQVLMTILMALMIILVLPNKVYAENQSTDSSTEEVEENLKWKLEDSDEDGFDDTLVVYGNSDMSNYVNDSDYPWNPYASSIVNIIVKDDVRAIGEDAFREFYNLENVTLGKNVMKIDMSAFEKCKKLSSITISENVKTIGWYAFKDCTSLTEVNLSDSVTDIGKQAFMNCTSLSKIKMSKNLEIIEDRAFYECQKLKNMHSIFLPKTLKKIGNEAFFRMSGRSIFFVISRVHYPGTKSDWVKIEGSSAREPYGDTLSELVHYVAHHEQKAATCTKSGFEEYWTCNKCGKTAFSDIECTQELDAVPKIPALGHDLDKGVVSEEANCIEEGKITYSCQREGCDYTEIQSIPKNQKHVYKDASYEWSNDNSECTASQVCSLCGYKNIETVKTEKKIIVPATCTQSGKAHCTALFQSSGFQTQEKDISVPKLEHKNTEVKYSKDATCENSGYTGDVYCKDCGKFLAEGTIIKAKGHIWDDGVVKKESTCIEQGEKLYTCFRCNATKIEKIAPTNHNWNDKETIDLKATCETSGRKSIHCNVCNEIKDGSQVIIPALGHNWSSGIIEKKATCTENGTQRVTCLRCGKVKEEVLSPTGHTEVVDKAVDPTCTKEGKTEGKHCSVCNKVLKEQRVMPAKGHSFTNWTTTKSPNCTDKGSKQRSCKVCGYTETEEMNANGHDWKSDYTVDVEPTCTTEGSKSIHCKNCDAVKDSKSIVALGHSYAEEIIKATITKNGKVVTRCQKCGEISTETPIPYPKKIVLSKTALVYNGMVQKSKYIVVGADGKSIPATNYSVVYSKDCKNVGKYTATITFKGNYEGTVSKTFIINPKGTVLKSLTAGVKKITVKWIKQTAQTAGYQIQYSTSSKFAKPKTVTITKNTSTSKAVTKLAGKKKYYVRIRTYKKVSGKNYYSAWSKSKTVKTK